MTLEEIEQSYKEAEGTETLNDILEQTNTLYRKNLIGSTIRGGEAFFGSGDKTLKFDEENGLWLGNADFSSASFRVNMSGKMTCTGADIGGTLTASDIHIPDKDTTANSFHVETDGDTFWGCTQSSFTTNNDNANAYILKDGTAKFQSVTLDSSVTLNPGALQSGSEIAIQGWQFDGSFSATDYDTVAWTSGTITLLDGTTYSVSANDTDARLTAAGLTSPMNALIYVYLDINLSTTELQCSYTASDAVGSGKILVAVAENNSDTSSDATYQVFGGTGGQTILVDNIAANSASTNEFVSNTAQIKDATITTAKIADANITTAKIANADITSAKIANLAVTNAKINDVAVDKLTAGTITSKIITLDFTDGSGDVAIKCGKTDFGDTTNSGFILGIDDSVAGNPAKFELGSSSTAYFNFDGTDITWKAANTELDSSGNLTASSATISGSITVTGGDAVKYSAGIKQSDDTACTADDINDGSTNHIVSTNEKTGAGRAYNDIDASGNFIGAINPGHNAPASGAGLYLGSDYMGYYDNTNWKTYMDSSGNFYLGGTSGSLTWDAGTNTLTIDGGEIVSSTFKTATTGKKIEINTSGWENELAFTASDGEEKFNIFAGASEGYIKSQAAGGFDTYPLIFDMVLGGTILKIEESQVSCITLQPVSAGVNDLGSSAANWDNIYCNDIYHGSNWLLNFGNNEVELKATLNASAENITGAGTIEGDQVEASDGFVQLCAMTGATASGLTSQNGDMYYRTNDDVIRVKLAGSWYTVQTA